MIENLMIFMNNYPIIFALGVIAITLAIIEIVMAMLMGFNLSSNIEVFLPDVDIDADANSFFVSWLGFGKVPFAITLYILFLSMFAISYLISSMYAFNQILMFLISLIISLIFVKMVNSKLALLFVDNTNSVSVKELLGASGYVVIGVAKKDYPAEICVKDKFNKDHHFMAEPEKDEEIHSGEKIIVSKIDENNKFKIIKESDI